MEQLYLEEEAAVAVAKAKAIDDELGIRPDPQELDLPEENSRDKVKFYLERQCEKNIDTTTQPGLSEHDTPLQQDPLQLTIETHSRTPIATHQGIQNQHETPLMTSTILNPLLQGSPPACQHTSWPPVDATSQLPCVDSRPLHFVPPCLAPSNNQTHLVSSLSTVPLVHTATNFTLPPHEYPSTIAAEMAPQNTATPTPQN